MESHADALAHLAHELRDQLDLEATLDRLVDSAAAVVGCDWPVFSSPAGGASSTRSPRVTR